MQKIIYLILFSLAPFCSFSQEPPSPESFLGYSLGSHFTPHFKIVSYFNQVALAVPGQVKVEQYGTTNEGRPLLLAFIASPENFRRLEDIRLNNLRLAGVTRDKLSPEENAPAIVWLSYNVHGNEPSSSEAAMKTLYELVNPSNPRSKEWLKNTIVIIDPCMNPDGRDRYVNWFTQMVGKNPNPDPQSREHHEPWPGGRVNHYNFDLNRDWAWQTQIETQQRLKVYNSWLPQVHVDFHEQGYNNPYYFAPAAEPYHDVITPWQREFQVLIGRNNAKYFDQNGWLYFTKQEFDLFYPSYGDTYPIYNGAIGMTYEQGGHSRGGLAVITADDDTLTLSDRLLHHYTTSMSTIELSSLNADKLVKEFRKYFADARSKPTGEFKSYFIKADVYGDRLDRLKSLLDKNNIEWVAVNSGSFTGLDYETGKTAGFKAANGDIAINTNQSKSNLLRVLFERNSRISDSVTYDITAWSLPYVYGLQAYGLNTIVGGNATGDANPSNNSGNMAAPVAEQPVRTGEYAYAVRWTGLRTVKFLAELLKKGVKTRYSEDAFQSGEQSFERGTLIITSTSNNTPAKNWSAIVLETAKKTGVTLYPVLSGFVDKGADFGSSRIHMIHKPKVALLTGQEVSSLNAGEVWHFFEQQLDYPITLINADEAGYTSLKNYDVLIMPDGYYKVLGDKNAAEPIRNWIREGGRLIAMGSAVSQLAKLEWGIRQKTTGDDKKEDDKKAEDYSLLRSYGNRERDEVAGSVPGSIYKVELDNTHPLAFGYPGYYYTLKQDDNVYEFIKEGGWNVGVIKKDNYISGFTGNKAKEKLKDGLVFGVEEMGRGEVIYMADDPLFRSFWENGKLLFCNAVFLVGQ
jgi:zinc carboxypeptidase